MNLEGQQFGRLTAQSRKSIKGAARWLAMCECGNAVEVMQQSLLSGNTKSCGCLRVDTIKTLKLSHGKTKTTEYVIWCGMIKRCHNPRAQSFENYGGRGISVCPQWRADFSVFFADMGPRPSPGHSLDRIDNDGGYEPKNCKWSTRLQQAKNRRPRRWQVKPQSKKAG